MVTVQQLDSGRNNNFDLLRFIAATLVIFSHSFLVTGNFASEPLLKHIGFLDLGAVGVKIFFAISGYLITKSMSRQQTLSSFVWARCLRIFPGLLVTAIFCAFVIGPLCTELTLQEYFSAPAVYSFVWQLFTLHNFNYALPGTFLKNPFPWNVNSPIWTLPAELMMYLAVLSGGVVRLLIKKQFRPLMAALPVLLLVAVFYCGMFGTPGYAGYVLSWGVLFLLGACCYLFNHKIILNIPLAVIMLVVFCIAFHFRLPYMEYLFDIALVYGILIFAFHPKLQVKGFHKLGDPSYGLYIYAFPIQQMLVLKFPALSVYAHFLVAFPATLVLAVLSWHFVEKPILRLKAKPAGKV